MYTVACLAYTHISISTHTQFSTQCMNWNWMFVCLLVFWAQSTARGYIRAAEIGFKLCDVDHLDDKLLSTVHFGRMHLSRQTLHSLPLITALHTCLVPVFFLCVCMSVSFPLLFKSGHCFSELQWGSHCFVTSLSDDLRWSEQEVGAKWQHTGALQGSDLPPHCQQHIQGGGAQTSRPWGW